MSDRSYKTRGYFLLIAMCLLFPIKGVAMSMFSGEEEEVVVFSPMEGVITFEGKPAVGAKIIRSVKWKDGTGESDEVITNAQGGFSFNVRKGALKKSISQFVAHQKIFVHYADQEFQVWGNGKLEKGEFTEFGGQPAKNLRCELTDDPDRVDTKTGWVVTSCQWNMED